MAAIGRSEIVGMLTHLKPDVRSRYKAELRGVFGSYARDEAGPASDVDVLVDFMPGASLLDWTGLAGFLEERLQRKVDVVSRRAIRPEIKEYIERDLIVL